MIRTRTHLALLALLACGTGLATGDEVRIVAADQLDYRPDATVPGVGIAVVAGDPGAGPYTIRVRFAPGASAPPHRHPDARTVTVLDGTYWFAQGVVFDDTRLQGYEAGTVLIVPAGVPHFSAARDSETVVQESGSGPTGLELIAPK